MWILTITLPCREWYAKERKRVRNREAALRFNIEYACGGFLKTVSKILDFSNHDLSSMLLVDNLHEGNAVFRVSEDHPLVRSQDDIAANLWRMSLCMVFSWIQASSPRMFCFPSAFLCLLSDDQDGCCIC